MEIIYIIHNVSHVVQVAMNAKLQQVIAHHVLMENIYRVHVATNVTLIAGHALIVRLIAHLAKMVNMYPQMRNVYHVILIAKHAKRQLLLV
jgi:hypothetical protein